MSLMRVADLEEGLDHVVAAPSDAGAIEMIVRRPSEDDREVVETAEIVPGGGLVGDGWATRSRHPNPNAEITLMNARSAALVAGDRSRWPLAGDQIYVDLDLSETNLPTGTRLRVGDAVVEVSGTPHTGCSKFSDRFGLDALRFVNQGRGKTLRLRGLNTRVVRGGTLRVGDLVTKIPAGAPL